MIEKIHFIALDSTDTNCN